MSNNGKLYYMNICWPIQYYAGNYYSQLSCGDFLAMQQEDVIPTAQLLHVWWKVMITA